MEKAQNKKMGVFVLFLVLFLGGAYFMYSIFLRGEKAVDPTTVPYRTKRNPYLVDSLKKAGYYDTFSKR